MTLYSVSLEPTPTEGRGGVIHLIRWLTRPVRSLPSKILIIYGGKSSHCMGCSFLVHFIGCDVLRFTECTKTLIFKHNAPLSKEKLVNSQKRADGGTAALRAPALRANNTWPCGHSQKRAWWYTAALRAPALEGETILGPAGSQYCVPAGMVYCSLSFEISGNFKPTEYFF